MAGHNNSSWRGTARSGRLTNRQGFRSSQAGSFGRAIRPAKTALRLFGTKRSDGEVRGF